jgi:uncharacterized OB-fold protein
MQRPYEKPLPTIEPDALPFWDSLREHRMRIQRCRACGLWYFPPGDYCRHCLSDDISWEPVIGKATVYSHVTMHRAYAPAYESEIPYNVSLVDLDEGVRLYTNVVQCAPSEVRVGMRVEVVYDDVTAEITLARFRPLRTIVE